ncbi:vWA domain-containing protein [Legionella impletisoli]|uniref:VWFA domain-containing protein n=1 Tax=Legionella impletisoli TaxID=343510 RepID=A0A917JVP5_9GAMM|nr:VWA domain-containing protein [Legionella impletisoli]GGI84737.1 hypothetical protein GCM10007966_11630 [Legionella impletisoli]
MAEFHFLRPYWLLAIIPLFILIRMILRNKQGLLAWSDVCDSHLLHYLMKTKQKSKRIASLWILFTSVLLMIVALAGPTWSRYPVPTFKHRLPRVIVLDMSHAMLENDLNPDRLTRAKFKLHDLFKYKDAGQFGLVVYTSEPFIVSPLTDDAETIDALLSSLTADIMPVPGQKLETALSQAAQLITQAGYHSGELLVLTGSPPSSAAIDEAKLLAADGIHTSILPITTTSTNPMFKRFAHAGEGEVISFSNTSSDIEFWLKSTRDHQQYTANLKNDIPVWKDQGRWFLIPALILLLPAFRRGWLQRLTT